MRRRGRWVVGAAVVLVAAATVGLNADWHGPPRYDGAGYSVLALSLIEGRGYREIDRPDAPRHDHFPPGYPLALAGLWAVVGRSAFAAHLLSASCTIGAAWLAWRWFRRVEPRGAADLLGLALALNWTWGAVGGSIQSEPLYLVLSLIALNAARARGWRASLMLGALLGSCVLTRHAGLGLLGAVLIDRVLLHHRAADSFPSARAGEGGAGGGTWRRWRDVAIIALTAFLVITPWIVWLASVRRNTQVGLLNPEGLLPRVASQALFYARRMPDALSGPFVEVATVFGRSRAVATAATAFALIVSAVILVGLVRCVTDPRRRLAGLVPLVTMPLLLVWPFTEAGRFLIPLVPCLLVGMVEGGAWLLRLYLPTTPHPSPLPQGERGPEGEVKRKGLRRASALIVLLAAVPYPAYAILSHRAEARHRSHDAFDDACAWIARDAKRPGPVLTLHPGEVYWQTGRLVVLPDSDDPEALVRQIRDQKVAYILVDEARFANAPPSPLARLVDRRPGLVRRAFDGAVAVDEVVDDQPR